MSTIHFIQTGGTIDKDYLETSQNHGYNFEIGESALHVMSQRVGIPYTIEFSCACKKDSLDLSNEDRDTIKNLVLSCRQDKVIITHGTDTIHRTAKHLSSIEGKVVVLTGSMKPERFRNSDADFNVGMAIGAIHHLPTGVYIALSGKVKRWDEYAPR